ncbi:MAG: hypothetical protein IT324_29300 [Anaerolineae bacterium]|nr:hypothetical protein [Anaerolineae bacterium]
MLKRALLVIGLLILTLAARSGVSGQGSPTIQSFSSDLESITPDQAESGTQYATLSWQILALRPADRVRLQVYVLDDWHDVGPESLSATGSLRWAVAHTLDFTPPKFRLIIRDQAGTVVAAAERVIPYDTTVDPQRPPQIVLFRIQAARAAPGTLLPVVWQIKNRPPRANLRFLQALANGQSVTVELPRVRTWINSQGQGSIRSVSTSPDVQIRLELFDIDTNKVYDQQTLTVRGAAAPPLLPSATVPPNPNSTHSEIVTFQVNRKGLQRGETLTASWQTRNAAAVAIDIYDIDYFPRQHSRPPELRFQALQPSGSLEIPTPRDYGGSGWQVHISASSAQPNIGADAKRIDILFTDAPQPVMLTLQQFDVSPLPIIRGSTVTIAWRASASTRGIDNAGNIGWVPTNAYARQLWMEVWAIYAEGNAPASPLNTRFDSQPLAGTMRWRVPDFDPAFARLLFNIGLTIDGTPVTYEVKSYDLVLATGRTETLNVAYQRFEHGFMIWNSKTGEVRVYIGDSGGTMQNFLQGEYSAAPDNPIQDAPPAGQVKPVNAFGRVWGNFDSIRRALGWALGPEQAHTLTLHFGTQQPGTDITFDLPDGRTIHVLGNTWRS